MSFEDERDEWSEPTRAPALEVRLSPAQRASLRDVLVRTFDTTSDPLELTVISRVLGALDCEVDRLVEVRR